MPVTPTAGDVGLRVLLVLVVAGAMGYDHQAQGHPAGVKTTMLVGLAACLSMIQANWLLDTVGKAPDSFVVLDLMRLPLGILTGVGFIGGGAILKRGDSVSGLTTAATLWFITVIGLCFGGGQLVLGAGGSVVGYLILHGLRQVEARLRQKRSAGLVLKWRENAFEAEEVFVAMGAAGLQLTDTMISRNLADGVEELRCNAKRLSLPDDHSVPAAIANLAAREGVLYWEWKD